MTRIELKDFHLGGISDSKYSGMPNSTYKLWGFDIHNEPGVLKVQQDVADDRASGDVINQKIRAIVPINTGKTEYFGADGAIWERSSSAVYTKVVADVAPSAGDSNILDAIVFGGYVYYSMPQRLGQWQIGTAWGTRNDDFAVLSFDDEYHPLIVIENDLYVGHANLIGKVAPDHATFTGAALTLEDKYTIQSLGEIATNLVIGTITEGTSAGSFSGFSHIMSWDLRSIDLRADEPVEEFGINAFMNFKGALLFQAGSQGNWYSFNGETASLYRRFPADWSGTNAGKTDARAISSYKGIPVIGFSLETGSPAIPGVYSFGGFDPKYPKVYNQEFTGRIAASAVGQISAIERIGTDMVFSKTEGSSHRIFKVDTTKKYNGSFIETQVINVDRDKWKSFKVTVTYRSLPAGSAIIIAQKTNDATSYSNITTKIWENKKTIEGSGLTINANNIQFRVTTTRGTDTNTAPEIESIIIDFDAK